MAHLEPEISFILEICYLVLNFFAIACNIVTAVVISKCRKFPTQMKIFMNNVALLDALSSATFVLVTIGENVGIIHMDQPRVFFLAHKIYMLLNFVLVTIMPLDRLLSLMLIMRYQVHITSGRTVAFCIFLWSVFGLTPGIFCVFLDSAIISSMFRYSIIVIFIIFISVNVKILLFVRKLNIQVHVANPFGNVQTVNVAQTPSPWKNLKVTFLHALLYIIVIVAEVLDACNVQIPLMIIIAASSAVVRVLNPVFFIYRFRECNLQFRILFSKCRNEDAKSNLIREKYEFYREDVLPQFTNMSGSCDRDCRLWELLDEIFPNPSPENDLNISVICVRPAPKISQEDNTNRAH